MKKFNSLALLLLSLGLHQTPLSAEETAPAPATEAPGAKAELLKNGSMEADANADQWPDDWPRHKDATWEKQGDNNHFIRLQSPAPGATVLLFQKVAVPAGAKVMELMWRQRISDLKPGVQAWFDARIMLEFRNAEDNKVPGAPGAPYTRKSTNGWKERSVRITVPEGATHFAFMPSLFQVESGTFDLDDFSLKVIEP
jgi:endoglucanase